MPVYKALILNKEIKVNYEENQKAKLIESINEVNNKLNSYDKHNGKISDSKLLSFLAIKLQAELIELKEKKTIDINLEKKYKESNNENINLNDKIFKLHEQNKLLEKENNLINLELDKLKIQIDLITSLIKKKYE